MRVGGCRACTVQRARYLRRRGLRHVGFSTTRAATGGCVRVGVAVVLMSVRSFLPTQPVNDPPERVPKDHTFGRPWVTHRAPGTPTCLISRESPVPTQALECNRRL